MVPEEGVLLRCLLTVGRRRAVEDGAEGEENEGVEEDKRTPAVPISCGDNVGVERRGVNPSCCGGDGAGDGVNKPTPATTMEGGVSSLNRCEL